ncbi:hypothetical protein [Acinetobacter sp.]|uniref:hypothetical protein n=1 Tax=Acinetobacter sp. TaxID=472 RepID=UPI00388EFAF5
MKREPVKDQNYTSIDVTKLSNESIRELYDECVEGYEISFTPAYASYTDFNGKCADAIVELACEAERRGLHLRTLH